MCFKKSTTTVKIKNKIKTDVRKKKNHKKNNNKNNCNKPLVDGKIILVGFEMPMTSPICSLHSCEDLEMQRTFSKLTKSWFQPGHPFYILQHPFPSNLFSFLTL